MPREAPRYRERTPWPGVVHAILWGVAVLSSYPILAGWDGDVPDELRWPIALMIFGVIGGVTWAVGGLTVRVGESGVTVHLGSVPLIRTFIPFAEIASLRSVVYRPIREFGGWGLRGFGRRKAWSARGNRAVLLELVDGREVLVGSDHPARLEERIRTLGAGLLGTAADDRDGTPASA